MDVILSISKRILTNRIVMVIAILRLHFDADFSLPNHWLSLEIFCNPIHSQLMYFRESGFAQN